MADYAQSIDFSAKDALATGNANKVAKGADIDTELGLISTAIASKVDESREAQASGIATLDGSALIPVGITTAPTNGGGQIPEASLTTLGAVELATSAEAQTGTNALLALTPATLQAVLDTAAGMGDDLINLVDPGQDAIIVWDDSDGSVDTFAVGTGLTSTTTAIEVDILGIEDLTDPGADRIMFWDDTAGITTFLTVTNGLEIAITDLQLVDVAATTTNPVDISTGAISLDVEALTTIEGNALAATDTFYIEDGGVSKGIEVQAMGLRVQTAQSTQTLGAADMNSIMEFDGTSTLTIDENVTVDLPIGVPIVIVVDHASQVVTVQADTSVTLNTVNHAGGVANASDTVDAGGTALLFQTATDEWYLTGDISD